MKNSTSLTEHGVDGEDVGRMEARRLRPEERPPGGTEPPPRWIAPGAREDSAHGCGRDADAVTPQLALDAQVPPAGVLLGQPQDQRDDLGMDRRATRTPRRVRPAPGHQATMPAQQGLGHDQEAGPAPSWEQARCGGQEGPVSVAELGPRNLPPMAARWGCLRVGTIR